MASPETSMDGDYDVVLGRITRGVAALRAENRQLRLELERL